MEILGAFLFELSTVVETQEEAAEQDETDKRERDCQGGDRDWDVVCVDVRDFCPSVVVGQSPVHDPECSYESLKCEMRGEGEISRTTEGKVRGHRRVSQSIVHLEVHPNLIRNIWQRTRKLS